MELDEVTSETLLKARAWRFGTGWIICCLAVTVLVWILFPLLNAKFQETHLRRIAKPGKEWSAVKPVLRNRQQFHIMEYGIPPDRVEMVYNGPKPYVVMLAMTVAGRLSATYRRDIVRWYHDWVTTDIWVDSSGYITSVP